MSILGVILLEQDKNITTETLLATVVRLFALDGSAKEVAILASSTSRTVITDRDWNQDICTLFLDLPLNLYHQIQDERFEIEEKIQSKLNQLLSDQDNHYYGRVLISTQLSSDDNWREKANAWLSGSNINNQGRVRSDNIASRSCDGLLFRSQPEINFYKALKSKGVSFAPLPVFIKGGSDYRRIEPDFVIIKDGIIAVVEVDGDTVHEETPAEAHARTTMLVHEGVHVERIKASECNTEEKAKLAATKILNILDKIKASR